MRSTERRQMGKLIATFLSNHLHDPTEEPFHFRKQCWQNDSTPVNLQPDISNSNDKQETESYWFYMEPVMKTIRYAVTALLLTFSLSSCSTLVGAGLGGAAGHAATNGSKAGTVGGAVLGGAIGNRF